ncbi:MAG: DNA adenine methylase [Candidatus Pacebacteria bacterium]|nr:DNA adenine methylase [Candidatus Paceibacterota bacterium]
MVNHSLSNQTDQVQPLASLVAYVGGKRKLAGQIVPEIESRPHNIYIEPFAGMASIFLARPHRAKVEVINDRSDEVYNFYRVIKNHPSEFRRQLAYSLTSRTEFKVSIDLHPAGLTDIQRAVRFYYLQRMGFAAKTNTRSIGINKGRGKQVGSDRFMSLVDSVHSRLKGVYIENMDWRDCLRYYDSASALFYLDPPYFGCEDYYNTRKGEQFFTEADHAALAETLMGLKGEWILSINDVPEIRELYSGRALIKEVTTRYTINQNSGDSMVTELLILKPRS